MTDYQKSIFREQCIAAELIQREVEWDVIEEVAGHILDPKDRYDLYDALAYAAKKWLADNGWAEIALDRLKYIDPTEAERETAERETREDRTCLCREWAREAI